MQECFDVPLMGYDTYKKKELCLDQQTTQVIPHMMMRLPGVAASIVAGQELVVPRWHTRVVNLVTQHWHTSSLWLSSGICLGTISLQWPAISPEKD